MQFQEPKVRKPCLNCGKEVPVRDARSKRNQYCSRVCAQQVRYHARYKGTLAGPMDRPSDRNSKMKF